MQDGSKMRKTNAGKLERKAVLKAICAGFEETTEPNVCLSDGNNKATVPTLPH